MSKIFGTLAAVILAVSALVAYKNKEAKEQEILTYQTSLKVEDVTSKELKSLLAELQSTEEEDTLAEVKKAEAELEDVVATHEKLKKSLKTLSDEYTAKSEELAETEELLNSLPDPDQLVPKIKRMRSELSEAKDSLASEEARLANLTQQAKNGKVRIEATRKQLSLRSSGKSLPNLKTRISSVYRNWGFVVLAAGDRAGVVTGSKLDVVRGGDVIAKLKVTAVEAGRASADILLDSVADGVTVQAGDLVVPESDTKTVAN